MNRKRTSILSHILLILLCILIRLPGKKEVQPPFAMFVAIALMEVLYLIRVTRHREQLRAASDLMVVLWGFLILWECAVTKLALMHPVLVPAPENVFRVFVDDRKVIATGVFSSLRLFLSSMIAGLVAGLAAGLICGWIRRLRDVFHPIASVLAPIPSTVFAPYVVALMPTFRSASAVVLILGIFWPTFLGMIVRIDGMDKGIMDSARAMNLSNASMILEILFPYAFAGVVGSLKVTFTTGIMLLIFAEMMGATSGMGYYIVNYNTYGNYTKVVAGIIVVGTVVTVLNKCIDVLQKKLIVWEM